MTDDLLNRLRDTACQGVELAIKNGRFVSPHEAADRIEKLEADNARLREVLGEVWDWIGNWSPDFIWDDEWPATEAKARAALQGTSQC